MSRASLVSLILLLVGAPAAAWACLNDFEIAMAEQQLRGAYAPAVSSAAPVPLVEIVAALGAIALLVALIRVARAA